MAVGARDAEPRHHRVGRVEPPEDAQRVAALGSVAPRQRARRAGSARPEHDEGHDEQRP